ncbi:MAG: cation transporter [Methanomicrobia archaeon]|nr:cation transporter [Methanomicrobia archaeon]
MERKTKNAFSEHLFEYRAVEKRKLLLSLSITSVVMVVEVIGGILTNSIALISDAGHMFTHSFAIGISLIAIQIARKPPCHHRTFGLYRAEILAAFINGLFLILVVGIIVYEAILRIVHPREVLGLQMFVIALVGLVVNVASILILRGSTTDLNVRSVFYHLIGDAASSIGIVIAAVVIFYTMWNIVDPLVSMGISALILYWAWGILKESSRILLELAPTGMNIAIIGDDLKTTFPEIEELYNVHLWAITPDMLVFSAHIKLPSAIVASDHGELLARITNHLAENYRIIESTLQIASDYEPEVCRIP